MSPREVAWRAYDQVLRVSWSRRQVGRDQPGPVKINTVKINTVKINTVKISTAQAGQTARVGKEATPPAERRFAVVIAPDAAERVPAAAKAAVVRAADRLISGEWEVLGVVRTDMAAPDWFADPVTGRQAPAERYAFRINHRSQEQTGNIKQVWEVSRLQHLTLLASAWFLTHDQVYARRAAEQLRSWWQENPFLSGVHWTSGIEVGLRLISMTWIRRLLADWPQISDLFEHDELALRQIRWHQQYLAAFRSRGSSANNHVIAEAAGQLIASCAFPWFGQSATWRRRSARLLERELLRNTFPSGIGRELASDYQCFVAELGLLAAVEAAAAGYPLGQATWRRLCAMVDSAAALVDERVRPPRQGDGDEGRGLLLDAPVANRWPSLLALGSALFGRLDWWPATTPDAGSVLIGALLDAPVEVTGRPAERPWHFADAGLTLLRTNGRQAPEIWCRCDGGPHGYLSIAAHAHADALSVEVRYGGVDILADPGTYCYHGEPAWRSYFRSTIAHNTVELGGQNQSADGGPFLWLRHANARELEVVDVGDAVEWMAEHNGYQSLARPARHRRCVRLDRAARSVDIVDEIHGENQQIRLAFHFGPDVTAEICGKYAILNWPGEQAPGQARIELAGQLLWSIHKGETDPILGWYSCGLGRRVPACTLVGCGRSASAALFTTRLEFLDISDAQQFTSAGRRDGQAACGSPPGIPWEAG